VGGEGESDIPWSFFALRKNKQDAGPMPGVLSQSA